MNLSNSFQIRLLTIVYILFLFSCKKKDNVPPSITVNKPISNSQYYAFQDYILCKGTVSDDEELDRIEYQLVDASGIPIMPKQVDFPDSNPYNFVHTYLLEDIHLNSGSYLMKITVFDKANNSKSKFREVIVYGLPRAKQGVFYVANNGASFTLGRIDSLDQDSIPIAIYPDYGGMEINNYDQQLFYMGYESTDLLAMNSRSYDIDWSETNLANPPGTYHLHQLNFTDDRYLAISLYSDQILKSNRDGTGKGNILLNYNNGQPETCFKNGNFFYVESKAFGTNIRRFQRYFFNSGGFDEEFAIDYDFKKIMKKEDDELLIFGNTGNQAVMKIFYTSGGNYFQPLNLFSGKFVDAFKQSDGNYFIVQENGVYEYTYSNNNLITKITESNILSADYDDLNDRFYLGFSNVIKIYSSSGLFLQSIPVGGDVINLKVHYNK